jgi:hypothetical protein
MGFPPVTLVVNDPDDRNRKLLFDRTNPPSQSIVNARVVLGSLARRAAARDGLFAGDR